MKSLQLPNKKSKRNLTKKSIKKNQKTKIDYSSSGGGGGHSFSIVLLLCSCYTPVTNHQSRHPPQDHHQKHHLHLILF